MGTPQTRRYKVDWLKQVIFKFFEQKPKQNMSKKKLLAQFALNTYSTKRTGSEILSLLEETGQIEINGDLISKK